MRRIFVLLICFISSFCFSQKIDSIFEKELEVFTNVNKLREKKINFIIDKKYSIGFKGILRSDDLNRCPKCDYSYSTYVIWKENNVNYLQCFDNCGNYYPLEIQNKNLLKFMDDNFDLIKKEKVKRYHVDKQTFTLIDHSSFNEFIISKNGNEIYNFFDDYNLSSDKENPNIYYSYNQNLKIVKLNYLIEDEIKKLDKLNLFKRDLSKCINN